MPHWPAVLMMSTDVSHDSKAGSKVNELVEVRRLSNEEH